MFKSDILRPIILGLSGIAIAFAVLYVYKTVDSDDIFQRMGVTLMAGLYAGLLFVVYVLPLLSDAVARFVYSDPGNRPEIKDSMHDARSFMEQGEYGEAVKELRRVVAQEPENRMALLQLAKIQAEQLEDPDAAVESLRLGLEQREWPHEDAAFLMFRISEIHLEKRSDHAAAVSVLQQICEIFPESRHSANAVHQLRELGEL